MDDTKFVKKRLVLLSIDVHPTDKALVIKYGVEAVILAESFDPVLADKKTSTKTIRICNLTESTNIKLLARQVIDKCQLIPPNQLDEVEQQLYYLQKRKDAPTSLKDKSIGNMLEDSSLSIIDEIKENANINDVDCYLEMLYDDPIEKLKGTAYILHLARIPDNLNDIFENEVLLSALARLLKEEWKQSTDLTTNILYIFFCFSAFSIFHAVIIHFQIGAFTMKIIEHELNAYENWHKQLAKARQAITDESNEEDGGKAVKQLSKMEKQLPQLITKQDQMLRVAFYLLLNISEDLKLEYKMQSKGIVEMLCRSLDRNNPDLLILVVSFLKKLSIYAINKNKMYNLMLMKKLQRIISDPKFMQNVELINLCLRLTMNLSFDLRLRAQIVKFGMLPKIVEHMKNEIHEPVAASILYHVSLDEKMRSFFTYTDCFPIIMRALLDSSQDNLMISALCNNLASNAKCAQIMTDGKGLQLMFKIAFKNRDAFLAKILYNLSRHDGPIKIKFLDFVAEIASQVTKATNSDKFSLECVGILANLTIPDLDFEMILKEFKLIDWLQRNLRPSVVGDSLAIRTVILLGTFCSDNACAATIAKAGIVQLLIELLKAKQEDDQMVLQIVYVFCQMVYHQSTRDIIINETEAPAYLIELMHDKNGEICSICDTTLDIVAEHEATAWRDKVRREKFLAHNRNWLEMIQSRSETAGFETAYGAEADDDDDEDNLLSEDAAMLDMYVRDADDISLADGASYSDLYGRLSPPLMDDYQRPQSSFGFAPYDDDSRDRYM